MLGSSGRITIGSVRGIAIRIHRSWIIIALLIAWSFYTRWAIDHAVGVAIGMAVVGAVLFFASVLVHELAHSLEAQHRGVEVNGITLFLFGGATETRFDVERPRDEFALTAVGPFSSFVLGAVFGLIAYYSTRAGIAIVPEVAGTLAWINIALGVFNLLPGAPLDGGRILRAGVWAVTKDRARAVRVASYAGQLLGYAIAALGLLQLFFVQGGLVGGIWFAFIGWFLAAAARGERQREDLKEQLEGFTVGDLVDEQPLPSIEHDADLREAADLLRQHPDDALAVLEGGDLVGVLLLQDVADVPAEQRGTRTAHETALPMAEVPWLPADAPLAEALEHLRGDQPIIVTDPHDDDVVHGLITTDRLRRLIQRTQQLDGPPRTLTPRSRRETAGAGHLPGGNEA